jgi:hypothetical protein
MGLKFYKRPLVPKLAEIFEEIPWSQIGLKSPGHECAEIFEKDPWGSEIGRNYRGFSMVMK